MAIDPATGPDVEFYGTSPSGLLSELATDLSGWSRNLTVDGGGLTETGSTRGDPPTHRTTDFRFAMNSGDSGFLYARGDNSIDVSAGAVTVRINAGSVIRHNIENIDVTDETFLLSVATQPNPLTTGAGDAYRSELWIHNYDQGTWESSSATHAADGSAGDDLVFLADDALANDFSGTVFAVRLSRAFHSSTETAQTFVVEVDDLDEEDLPVPAGRTRVEFPVPTRGSGIGDDGMHAGPVEAMAAKAQRSDDLIMAGPIVNEMCSGAWAEDSTWTTTDPSDADYAMHLEFLRRRPIPPGIDRARVRVFVQQNAAGAEALRVRCYCANAPGPISRPVTSPDDYAVFFTTASRTADDGTGSGVGAWLTLGTVKIARDLRDAAWFWLGFYPGSVTDYRILAWTVEPVQSDDDGSGLGSGGGFGS